MYIGLHIKYPLFLSDFNETSIFLTNVWKVLKYQISWKSVQWELGCSMQMDRRADMTNLIVTFCNFANMLENCWEPCQIGSSTPISRNGFTFLSNLHGTNSNACGSGAYATQIHPISLALQLIIYLSTWNNYTPTRSIFVELYTWNFYENFSPCCTFG
jgi:hypothetical protein